MWAKVKGEFVWRTHVDTDELFLVVEGQLTIQLRDRGVEHCPRADDEVKLGHHSDRNQHGAPPLG